MRLRGKIPSGRSARRMRSIGGVQLKRRAMRCDSTRLRPAAHRGRRARRSTASPAWIRAAPLRRTPARRAIRLRRTAATARAVHHSARPPWMAFQMAHLRRATRPRAARPAPSGAWDPTSIKGEWRARALQNPARATAPTKRSRIGLLQREQLEIDPTGYRRVISCFLYSANPRILQSCAHFPRVIRE